MRTKDIPVFRSIHILGFLIAILLGNTSLSANDIGPGQTGEVTIILTEISGTVSSVYVGAPIGGDASYISSNSSGT